jgi:hypothetical protein
MTIQTTASKTSTGHTQCLGVIPRNAAVCREHGVEVQVPDAATSNKELSCGHHMGQCNGFTGWCPRELIDDWIHLIEKKVQIPWVESRQRPTDDGVVLQLDADPLLEQGGRQM